MTKLLETAFQKLSTEFNESEQDLFISFPCSGRENAYSIEMLPNNLASILVCKHTEII